MARPRRTHLPDSLQAAIAAGEGLISADKPTSRQYLHSLGRKGLLTKLAHGQYTGTELWGGLSGWEQFALASRAYQRSCGDHTYLAGWSAATLNGLPQLGRPPQLPDAVHSNPKPVGAQRNQHGRTRREFVPPQHLREYNGVPATGVGYTASTIALSASLPIALAVGDHALRRGANLMNATRDMKGRSGITRTRWVANHATGLAESPLESLGRFAAYAGDLPLPIPNAWVGDGKPMFRLDGLWPWHWAGFEADGAVKYNNRADASKIVFDQNEREWLLRRLSLDLCRFGWQLAYPRLDELILRFAQLLAANPVRHEPIRWWKHDPLLGPVEPEPDDWPSKYPSGIVLPPRWWVDTR
ncbi:hypothetical protein IEU95_07070 [Hoyosella rhizosphaerae]|uniref:Type IV toxin-antitoxin system AbiEi family antitoxin domain-containing protein n=1 Tax=Hoyosella rhizosphaerae TaxID=1755582 RepID=A0A916X9V6_9ACTN|nr:hypothetical protein [Hoyosella rhizosphaerae]MBN4926583.1 hypothetical protein [Hoyosella rhizosphaerae]GGC58128.1 hypothetical protein GCM10011410_08250 [Hoyosella rhizosphaerae]